MTPNNPTDSPEAEMSETTATAIRTFENKDGRVAALQAELKDAIAAISRPEQWTAYLTQMARFHRYSFRNTLLMMCQRTNVTLVAGANDWRNKHKRFVNKGEKAMWVLAPMIRKDAVTDERVVIGFRGVCVFDVSQTNGEPVAAAPAVIGTDREGDAPEGMWDALVTVAETLGYTVTRGPATFGEKGVTR